MPDQRPALLKHCTSGYGKEKDEKQDEGQHTVAIL
jgi:hypothetical protein